MPFGHLPPHLAPAHATSITNSLYIFKQPFNTKKDTEGNTWQQKLSIGSQEALQCLDICSQTFFFLEKNKPFNLFCGKLTANFDPFVTASFNQHKYSLNITYLITYLSNEYHDLMARVCVVITSMDEYTHCISDHV